MGDCLKRTKIVSSLSLLAVLFSVTNCAPKLKHLVSNTKSLKLGYIVHADKDEVAALMAAGTEVRVISDSANIFEIKGMEKGAIVKALGKSEGFEIEKNRMIYNPEVGEKVNPVAGEKKEETGLKVSVFENKCVNNPFNPSEKLPENAPIPSVDPANLEQVFHADVYGGAVTNLNTEIKFTGINSIATDEKIDGKLNYAWLIMAPTYSKIEFKPLPTTEDVSFKTDALGEYSVGLLVQDQNNVCNYTEIKFGVTANATFKPTEFPVPSDKEFYDRFQQISMMGILDAWKNTQGEGIKVAVIDTGVNYLHPYLSRNIAINSNEIPGNKIDDDQNGFIDDVFGWDFVNEDSMPFDDNGHGTHVAGLIASTAFGVAPKAKIIPVKVFNTGGGGDLGTVLMAFIYAVDQGADVINFSGGADTFRYKLLNAAMVYAKSKNVTIVVAAGNSTTDNDVKPTFPTNLSFENLLQVASTNSKNELSFYSNYGAKSVKFAAPGGDEKTGGELLSTAVWNPKGSVLTAMQGTSMSSPLAAGTVALMLSMDPLLKSQSQALETILAQTLVPSETLVNKVKYPGVINAGNVTEFIKAKNSNK